MKEEILQYIKDNLRIRLEREDDYLVVELYLNTDDMVFDKDRISINRLLQPND